MSSQRGTLEAARVRDLTPAMLAQTRQTGDVAGPRSLHVALGDAAALPVASSMVAVATVWVIAIVPDAA